MFTVSWLCVHCHGPITVMCFYYFWLVSVQAHMPVHTSEETLQSTPPVQCPMCVPYVACVFWWNLFWKWLLNEGLWGYRCCRNKSPTDIFRSWAPRTPQVQCWCKSCPGGAPGQSKEKPHCVIRRPRFFFATLNLGVRGARIQKHKNVMGLLFRQHRSQKLEPFLYRVPFLRCTRSFTFVQGFVLKEVYSYLFYIFYLACILSQW